MSLQSAKNEFRMPAKEFDRVMMQALQAPRLARHSEAAKSTKKKWSKPGTPRPKVDAPGPMPCVPYSLSVVKCTIPV